MPNERESGPSKRRKNFLAEVLSFFDPELQVLAIRLAKAIPQGSIIRTKIFARVFGPLKAWVEESSEGMNPIIGAVLEKLIDFGDAFSTIITEGKTAAATTQKTEDVTKEEWIRTLLEDAKKRIQGAKDPEAEFEKIRVEFELRLKLIEFIRSKMAPEDKVQPQPQPQSQGDADQKFLESLKKLKRDFWNSMEEIAGAVDTSAEKLAAHVGRLADWLEEKGGIKS